MIKYLQKNKFGLILILFTLALAGIVLITAIRLYTIKNSTTAPTNSKASGDEITSCQVLVINLPNASPSPSPTSSPNPNPDCLIYAVHDQGAADTQFISINPKTSEVKKIGPLYKNYNAESLEYDAETGHLYTVVRQDIYQGKLVIVNSQDGSLTVVGDTGSKDILALAINNSDHSLWGWENKKGLVKIDKTTGHRTQVMSSSVLIGGIAWDNKGEFLYAASKSDSKLYRYDASSNSMTVFATNLPGNKNEALEMNSNNILLGGFDGAANDISIFAYDTNTKSLLLSGSIPTPYNDIEGIAWPDQCGEIPPIDTEPILSQCMNIRFYDEDFNLLTVENLKNFKAGDSIIMSVTGSTTDGLIDKARFTINGVLKPETTKKRSGTDEFYYEYTIPENTTQLKVDAEVHHNSLGWY